MKIIKVGTKEYPVKFTFGNIKRTKLRTEEELKSGDVAIMLDHIFRLFACGLNGLGKYSDEQVENIIQDYIDDGGNLIDLATSLNEEYVKSLGLKIDQLP